MFWHIIKLYTKMKINFTKSIASFVNRELARFGLKFGVGAKFTIVILSVTLLAILPTLLVSQRILSKSMESIISTSLTSDTSNKIDTLSDFFNEKLSDLRVITSAYNLAFQEGKHTIDERSAYWKDFAKQSEVYASLSVYDLNGIKIIDTRDLEIGADDSQEYFFQQAIAGNVYFDSFPFISTSLGGMSVMRISIPIQSAAGKAEGVLLANIPTKEIGEILTSPFAASFPTVKFYLINKDGVLIASSHQDHYPPNADMKDWDVFKLFKTNNRDRFTHITSYEGEESLFISVRSREIFDQPGVNWFLFASIPTRDVFAPITNAEMGIAIIAIGLLLLVLPFSVFIAGTLTKPIYILTEAAKKISEGDFEQEIDISSQDEIGTLAKVFSKMIVSIKTLYLSLESKNKELSEKINVIEEKNKDLKKIGQEVFNSLEDVQRQKEQLQRQFTETKKFKQAVDSSTDAIFMTDKNAHIIYANHAWEKLNGYELKEVLGKNPNIIKSGKTDEGIYEKMWEVISKGGVFFTESLINKNKRGEEYEAQLTIYPIKEGDQVMFFVGAEQDITERKIIERSKTEFVSIASHQLRTPLTTINLFAEMIEKGDAGKLNKKQQEYIYQVRHSIKRMIALVNDLLNVSRIETGRLMISPKLAYLEDIIEDVIKECGFLAKDKVCKIEFKRAKTKMPEVMVDGNLLHQVLHNLVVNAITYSSPERCQISVTLSRRVKENDYLISIKDNGIGVPEDAKPKLFRKFFRGDNAIKTTSDGTGLGLYLVKMVMTESGGNIWFESEENKGSIFYVSIPLDGMKEKAGEKTLEVV